MAIIKCKACGGDIELTADKTYGMCEWCGSAMTLPKIDDDQRAAAFNRGNHFRRIGEFDKALAVYERIVREDDTDAEAHWCCALCRFGIEYVEDPATYEWLPTCHRASFDSFLEDVDYKAALEYSEGITRRQYMRDGAKIAEVQRGILATSQNAEPYDVFICYKESDADGNRTRDSLMAQDIYYQLTEQGRKVFFARITLEDVAGTQYEPYIFAALNSAKVMIVVGTKPEHLNAVWVKNEWSRFLAMMKKDRHKLLLPCYRDMDPYEMPEALSVLQSYDMSKIGFIQDLIRGISKVLDAEKKAATTETVVVQQSAVTPAAPLLQRAFMFLEDEDWESANQYCEKVLDLEPQNARAYVGKLMVDMHIKTQSNLSRCTKPYDDNANYLKAVRFADAELKKELEDAVQTIKNRLLEMKYRAAKRSMEKVHSNSDYLNIAQEFVALGDYKDSAELVDKARELYAEGEYKVAASKLQWAVSELDLNAAIDIFRKLGDYKDSRDLIVKCKEKIEDLFASKKYKEAIAKLDYVIDIQEFATGIQMLAELGDYKDAAELKEKYKSHWNSLEETAKAIWEDYRVIHQKLLLANKNIDKAKANIEQLRKDCDRAKGLLQETMQRTANLAKLKEQLGTNQAQLAQSNKELSSLGMFAFSQKRELSALIATLTSRCARLEQEIASEQHFIKTNGTVEALGASIKATERSIEDRNAQINNLNEELQDFQKQMDPVLEKLRDRQIIAMLHRHAEILPVLVDEPSIAVVIKSDDALRYMIKSSENFYLLPRDKQKTIFGTTSSLDCEAIYYQACQAMDEVGKEDDLRWAMEQFQKIENYKDSRKRIETCKARLNPPKEVNFECEMCGTKQTGRPQGSVAVCKMCGHKQTWG